VKAAAGKAKPPAAKSEDDKRQEALDFIVETVEALIAERRSDEKIWGSMVKTTMQRRRPGFKRIVLWLPLVQGFGGRRAKTQTADGGARRRSRGQEGYTIPVAAPD